MTDLRRTAQVLAAQGRFGDTMLIHVNPAEVAGIASLVPGGLTINPQTGLPEAFWFLPFLASMVAPAAAAAAPVAAAAAPLMAGAGAAASTLASTIGAGLTGLGTAAAPLTAAAETLAATAPAAAAGAGGLGSLAAIPEVASATAALPAVAEAAPAALAPAVGIDTLTTGAIAPASQAAATLPAQIPNTASLIPGGGQQVANNLVFPNVAIENAEPVAANLAIEPAATPATMGGTGMGTGPGATVARIPDVVSVADTAPASATTPRIPIPETAPPRVPGPPAPAGAMPPSEGVSYETARRAAAAGPQANTPGKGPLGGIGDWIKNNKMLAMGLGAMGLQALQGMGGGDEDEDEGPDISKIKYKGGSPKFPGKDYRPGISPEHRYFANNGGLVSLAKGGLVKGYAVGGPVDLQAQMPHDMSFPQNGVPGAGGIASLAPEEIPTSPFPTSQIGSDPEPPTAINPEDDQELIMQTVEAIQGKHPDPDTVIMAFVKEFGEEALQDLVTRVRSTQGGQPGGRLIQGPGDGQSDSVMASIDGQQPAALSQGEVVIPADAVSGLGNGSTDAGASQLMSMVENIRKSRGGSPQQPPPIQGGIAAMMNGGLVRGYQDGGMIEDEANWYMDDPLNASNPEYPRTRFPKGLLEEMGLGAARDQDAPMDQYEPYIQGRRGGVRNLER